MPQTKYEQLVKLIEMGLLTSGMPFGSMAIILVNIWTKWLSGPAVVDDYEGSVDKMAIDYINYVVNRRPRPEWVAHLED